MPPINGAYIQITGADQAGAYLKRLSEASRDVGQTRLTVGSPLVYSFGIETGRTRRGRVARRAGGAFMLHLGLAAAQRHLPALIARAIETGDRGAGKQVEDAIRRTVLGQVQRRTPVRTGRLRSSFVVRSVR